MAAGWMALSLPARHGDRAGATGAAWPTAGTGCPTMRTGWSMGMCLWPDAPYRALPGGPSQQDPGAGWQRDAAVPEVVAGWHPARASVSALAARFAGTCSAACRGSADRSRLGAGMGEGLGAGLGVGLGGGFGCGAGSRGGCPRSSRQGPGHMGLVGSCRASLPSMADAAEDAGGSHGSAVVRRLPPVLPVGASSQHLPVPIPVPTHNSEPRAPSRSRVWG